LHSCAVAVRGKEATARHPVSCGGLGGTRSLHGTISCGGFLRVFQGKGKSRIMILGLRASQGNHETTIPGRDARVSRRESLLIFFWWIRRVMAKKPGHSRPLPPRDPRREQGRGMPAAWWSLCRWCLISQCCSADKTINACRTRQILCFGVESCKMYTHRW
jgi:hypothetical protein